MNANNSASTHQVSEWLSNFGSALDRADFDAAVNMFEEDGYWRDLVSLTWNIKTLEGRENIKAMLEATVPEAKPGPWRVEGDATSDNGVISSWLTFETAVSRGKGQIRLKDGKCWTLLTTMTELKGFEEKKVRLVLKAFNMVPVQIGKTGSSEKLWKPRNWALPSNLTVSLSVVDKVASSWEQDLSS